MREIVEYYNDYDEDGRLERDNSHRTEFALTLKLISPYLQPGSRILDAGAGTGRYSLHYAAQGHRLTALDLTPKHVELIRGKAEEYGVADRLTAVRGNALDLSAFGDGVFDAVFCMGPLYHLRDQRERETCIEECLRVVKPGGIIAAAYVNLAGAYLCKLTWDPDVLLKEPPGDILTRNVTWDQGTFHNSTPSEIEALMSPFALRCLEHSSTDGISPLLRTMVDALNPAQFAQWLEFLHLTCRDPRFLGAGLHNLYVAQKI